MGLSVEPPAPTFEDSDDTLRWRLVHSVESALADMIDKYQACFEQAQRVEKAFSIADAPFVNGVRQQETSKNQFRRIGTDLEQDLIGRLGRLREATIAAQSQWTDLVRLLPGSESDMMKISNWCMSRGVDSEVMSLVLTNGVLIGTDFGVTRESFWNENERLVAIMQEAGL
jgi:hypothetical protein